MELRMTLLLSMPLLMQEGAAVKAAHQARLLLLLSTSRLAHISFHPQLLISTTRSLLATQTIRQH
jgi:hypothetical protein